MSLLKAVNLPHQYSAVSRLTMQWCFMDEAHYLLSSISVALRYPVDLQVGIKDHF